MRALWDAELPEACDNTLLIAERCDVGVHRGRQDLMPRVPGARRARPRSRWLRQGGRARAAPRGSRTACPTQHRKQAEYELGVIIQMGFPGYFLVVADLVRHAKRGGIRVGPGRGSAAGSLVAYALGITELDPIEHKLLFERFLNPERISMPDIDMDFDERRRGDMIRYATEKYGEDRVAQIITYGTIKAKRRSRTPRGCCGYPLRDGRPDHQGDAAAGHGQGHAAGRASSTPRHTRYAEAAEFRALYEADPEVKRGRRHRPRAWRASSGSGACTRPA